jgi:hypothetical protein
LGCKKEAFIETQAVALRSRIALAAAADRSNQQTALDLAIPEVTVGKWRRSFAEQGLEGLRDAPRPVWQKVQTLACQQPKSQGRWTVRTLAREAGLPHSTVHANLNARNCNCTGFEPSTLVPSRISKPNCWTALSFVLQRIEIFPHQRHRDSSYWVGHNGIF